MDLRKYDGKRVQITMPDGMKFEGISDYCSDEYCESEYGRAEDALQVVNFLFCRSDIWAIRDLEEHPGPYDGFTAPFGRIEEWNVRDGIDAIRDHLTCEEDIHVLRMLRCLEDRKNRKMPFPDREQIPDALREALSFIEDPEVRKEAERLREIWT